MCKINDIKRSGELIWSVNYKIKVYMAIGNKRSRKAARRINNQFKRFLFQKNVF